MSIAARTSEEAEIIEHVFRGVIERDRPLSFHWQTLDQGLLQSLGVPLSRDNVGNRARNSILTEAVLASSEGYWVSYSRHKAFYSGLSRYHGTSYTYATVLAAVDELLLLGLIEEERSRPGQRGWQSRFRATQDLVTALAEAPLTCKTYDVIRLKDGHGKLVDYRDTDTTARMRRELRGINEAFASICLDLPALDIVRTPRHLIIDGAYYRQTPLALHRIFNRGSFKKGGRAYGWYQSLPKARRQQLLINGEPTAEPDFVQLHPSILYAERGHVLKGDAYETGEFSRDMGKLACNVALNARTRQGAISALCNKADWSLSAKDTAKLLDAIARHNAPIAGDLHADRGITLMRCDSEITLAAVKDCINAGIPAVPIHDSMLTPKRHESRVAEIMEKSAARVLKRPSPCRVSVSRPPVPQTPSRVVGLPLPAPSRAGGSGVLALQLDLFPGLLVDSFSLQMKRLRDRLGLSQKALADRIGCQQPHVANVESGRRHLGDWPCRRLRDLIQEAA